MSRLQPYEQTVTFIVTRTESHVIKAFCKRKGIRVSDLIKEDLAMSAELRQWGASRWYQKVLDAEAGKHVDSIKS